MKIEKFKVLLYLKKSGLDKKGKAPIMGRITLNNSMAQFSTKLSCTPELWNPRESRLNGKSKEAVETNGKIDRILLSVNAAYDSLVEKKADFCATDIKNQMQGSMETQMTFMRMVDTLCNELKSRIGVDRAKGTYPTYYYTRRSLVDFIAKYYHTKDLAFGQMKGRRHDLFALPVCARQGECGRYQNRSLRRELECTELSVRHHQGCCY